MACSFVHVMQFNPLHGGLRFIKSMDMFRNLRSRHPVINAAFERCMGSLAAYKRSESHTYNISFCTEYNMLDTE
jgi:hypothetical protein